MKESKDFWNNRYLEKDTGWDLGKVSPPLKNYFDQLTNKTISILIPGAGNAYEAEYLHKLGFTNVIVVDIAPKAIEQFKQRVPTFPKKHIINMNFFELTTQFDILIEQTFFCAINPSLRNNYMEQAHKILKPNSKIVGVLFNVPLNQEHPPYGGNIEEYKKLFSPKFNIEIMEAATNSIESRTGRELFIKMIKPQ